MKSLEIQDNKITKADELVCPTNLKALPRRQSSVRREIIVEGEFCESQSFNLFTVLHQILSILIIELASLLRMMPCLRQSVAVLVLTKLTTS